MCNKTDAVLIPNRNTPLRVVLGTTELAINCLGLILNLALCVVLLKTQMLLIISKMLIMNSIIASVIALSTRYFAALHMLSEDRLFDGWLLEGSIFIHNCALMMTTINEVVLVCVCWATLCWNKKFCKRTLWIMGTTFVILPWFVAATILVVEAMNLINSTWLQSTLMALNVGCVTALITLASFGYWNYRRQDCGDVQGKYRASVFIRTLALLRIAMITTAIRTAFATGFLIVMHTYMLPNCLLSETRTFSYFFDLVISFHALIQPILMIKANQELARLCCNNLLIRFRNPTVTPSASLATSTMSLNRTGSPEVAFNFPSRRDSNSSRLSMVNDMVRHSPRNAIGQLIVNEQSQEDHFRQLNLLWS